MRKIADIMSTDCVTLSRQASITEAARIMKDRDIGFIPVVEGRRLVGVVTDRDLVIRGYADNRSGSEPLDEVLSNDVRTITSDMSVDDAAAVMAAEQIRRLPVVDDGQLEGIVSIGDLAVREIFVNEAGEALSEISEPGGSSSYAH